MNASSLRETERRQPDVTVIVPIYNTERYLRQCLDSIVQQTLSNIEIVCIDDGCTDGSPAIMDEYAAQDSRVRVVHKENGGYGAGVNVGLSCAHGRYIAIVEPDDWIDTSMYEKLIRQADCAGDPDIVKACYWRVCNADTPEQTIEPGFYLHTVSRVGQRFTLDEDAEFLFHHPSIWTAIYRRDFLADKGIRMHEIPGAGWADNPWLIETLAQASSIVYLEECLYFYREFNTGSSSNVKDPSIIYKRWLDMDDIVKRLGITSPRILEGHYNRGCAYIEMLAVDFGTNRADIRRAIDEMASRIDFKAVVSSDKIPGYFKRPFVKYVGLRYYLKHPGCACYLLANRVKAKLRRS